MVFRQELSMLLYSKSTVKQVAKELRGEAMKAHLAGEGTSSNNDHEPSLLHPTTADDTAPCQFYIVAGSKSFDDLFFFLEHHFMPRIAWAGLRLSFKKLRPFVPEVIALGVYHEFGGHLNVTPARTEKSFKWPASQSKRDVKGFWGPLA